MNIYSYNIQQYDNDKIWCFDINNDINFHKRKISADIFFLWCTKLPLYVRNEANSLLMSYNTLLASKYHRCLNDSNERPLGLLAVALPLHQYGTLMGPLGLLAVVPPLHQYGTLMGPLGLLAIVPQLHQHGTLMASAICCLDIGIFIHIHIV